MVNNDFFSISWAGFFTRLFFFYRHRRLAGYLVDVRLWSPAPLQCHWLRLPSLLLRQSLGVFQKRRWHPMVGLLGGICPLLRPRILFGHVGRMGSLLLVHQGEFNFEQKKDSHFSLWHSLCLCFQCVFLVWLMSPLDGSSVVYNRIILPLFNKNQSKIDSYLNKGKGMADKALKDYRDYLNEAAKLAAEMESKKSE